MPSSTPKQARTMRAAAHDPSFAKKLDIPQSVAREFVQADKGPNPKGSDMKSKPMMMDKMMKKAPKKMMGGGKAYASGGLAAGHKAADGIAKKGKTKAMQVKMAGGGKC
jgi:hypothetical protein